MQSTVGVLGFDKQTGAAESESVPTAAARYMYAWARQTITTATLMCGPQPVQIGYELLIKQRAQHCDNATAAS